MFKKIATLTLVMSIPVLLAAGESIYEGKCLKCHGANGDGQGKAAKFLKVKPTDFSSAKWQASVKDADIVEAITHGGTSKTLKLDKKMPAYEGKLKPEEIQAQVKVIRAFGKGAADVKPSEKK